MVLPCVKCNMLCHSEHFKGQTIRNHRRGVDNFQKRIPAKEKFLQAGHPSKEYVQVNWTKVWYQNTKSSSFNIHIKDITFSSINWTNFACIDVFRSDNTTDYIWCPPYFKCRRNITITNLQQYFFWKHNNIKQVRNQSHSQTNYILFGCCKTPKRPSSWAVL